MGLTILPATTVEPGWISSTRPWGDRMHSLWRATLQVNICDHSTKTTQLETAKGTELIPVLWAEVCKEGKYHGKMAPKYCTVKEVGWKEMISSEPHNCQTVLNVVHTTNPFSNNVRHLVSSTRSFACWLADRSKVQPCTFSFVDDLIYSLYSPRLSHGIWMK